MHEPTRLVGAINAALTATLGVFTLVGILDEKVAGGLGIALAAWITVAAEYVRMKVTPVDAPVLTAEQNAKVEVKG